MTIVGAINQSVQDGTGPAVNNTDLNSITDGDSYTVNLSFLGSISSPGTFDLTDFNVTFGTSAAGLVERGFNSATVSINQSSGLDTISILACLTSGSGCSQGNELDLNFATPAMSLNAANAVVFPLFGLLPFDLLEDDGITDIHGSVTGYSYAPSSAVPEPSALFLLAGGFAAVVLKRMKRPAA